MSIGANTNIKICMKLEDPLETWDFFMKTAGESFVTTVESFQSDEKSMTGQYMDTKTAKVDKRARVDLLDLKDQREGEAHVFFKSKLVRAKMFYANPDPVEKMRLNHFVRVEAPKDRDLYHLAKSFEMFEAASHKGQIMNAEVEHSPVLEHVFSTLQQFSNVTCVEAGVNVLTNFQKQVQVHAVPAINASELAEGMVNIFNSVTMNAYLSRCLITDNADQFCLPLLNFDHLRDDLQLVERLIGMSESAAISLSNEMMSDFELVTQYPFDQRLAPNVDDAATSMQALISILETTND